jgi:hypothetical protein
VETLPRRSAKILQNLRNRKLSLRNVSNPVLREKFRLENEPTKR